MSEPSPFRPLLLSLTVALLGAVAVVGLPPLAGSPLVPAAAVPAAAVDLLPDRSEPPPSAPAVTALPDVLREQRSAGLDCALSQRGTPVCVHGHDRSPREQHVAGAAAGSTATGGQIGCYGTGSDGPRVQAVYARPQSGADRYATSVGSIRGWAAGISRQFDTSAQRTGGRRHVRFATTSGAGCTVTVLNIVLPDAAFRSFNATIDALEARGLDAPTSKYLVWADTSGVCGLATTFADDSAGLTNLNNGRVASYARVDRSCWGKVETHELVHMLGGVQTSARNSTGGFHCNDGLDVMCYDDGTARSGQKSVCGKEAAVLLDCRSDDYFSTSAPAGSYLRTHWNTASSSFLATSLTDPVPASPTPTPATSAPPSTAPSPSASPTRAIPGVHLPVTRELLRSVDVPPTPSPLPLPLLPATLTAVAR